MRRRTQLWTAAVAVAGLIVGCSSSPTPKVETSQNGDVNKDAAQLARSTAPPQQQAPTQGQPLETFALFQHGPMPTGVAVSHTGRTFVCFPRWGDPVKYTVGEITNGQARAYPDQNINTPDQDHAIETFISVQSVVVDPKDRLWILDSGNFNMGPNFVGGPKLVCVDLTTNQITKKIVFPTTVALEKSYLNDVRFDLTRGPEGTAYITDSSATRPGIIVVDLASAQSWRALDGDKSTLPDPHFQAIVEGQPLVVQQKPGDIPAKFLIGSDGVALAPDGKTLFYRPLWSHHLYSVPTDALADRNNATVNAGSQVKDYGDIGFASDGLEFDNAGNLYLTDYENNAIHRRTPDGNFSILVQDPRMLWPDSMAVGTDGYLYFTCNQLERQPKFHQGKDLRQSPYVLFRTKIGTGPVMLMKEGT